MASGFTGGEAPDFFTGRSTNQSPQPSHRSNLPGLFLDPSTQIARHQQQPQQPHTIIGKRTLSDYQAHQFQNHQAGLIGFFHGSVEPRTFQHTSPISPLSPIDFSAASITTSSLERSSFPILQQFRPQPISNSSEPHLHGASKKNLDQKFSVVAQEALHPIAEEQFFHNHQESIKAQTKATDIDEFLTSVSLDNDLSKGLAFPCAASPVWSKLKPESPLKYSELEDMTELLSEDDGSSWKHELSGMPASPPPFTPSKDYDFINFKLMESPEVTKN